MYQAYPKPIKSTQNRRSLAQNFRRKLAIISRNLLHPKGLSDLILRMG